jgi:hypothetical protein
MNKLTVPIAFLIIPVIYGCSTAKGLHHDAGSMMPTTLARRCYDAWMSLGYSTINQYEPCPLIDQKTAEIRFFHDDINNPKRSQVGFGEGENKKEALDASIRHAVGFIPIKPDRYTPYCESNIFRWECAVIVEWFNTPKNFDMVIDNKNSPITYYNCTANGVRSICIQGDSTMTKINR